MTKEAKAIKKTLPGASVFSRDAYESFGAHPTKDKTGYVFRVFAPNADSVSVCGDFNGWDPHVTPMQRAGESGIWETIVKGAFPNACKYKYFLRRGDWGVFKSDPFGTHVEKHPNAASVIAELDHPWRDGGWLSYRAKRFVGKARTAQTIAIYRVDPLWWKRHHDGSPYRLGELTSTLIPYAKQMGYTHIELLGVIGGFSARSGIPDALFAPSPFLGKPRELMSLIDSAHEAGMGVILDWNPYCFAAGEHGLAELDGTPLFEGTRREGEACFFDPKKPGVLDLLTANALFWASKYHADGLSVAPYQEQEGTASLLRTVRTRMRAKFPDVMLLSGKESNTTRALMGSEFGDTWTEGCERALAWWLLEQSMHAKAQLSKAIKKHSHLSERSRGASHVKTNQD